MLPTLRLTSRTNSTIITWTLMMITCHSYTHTLSLITRVRKSTFTTPLSLTPLLASDSKLYKEPQHNQGCRSDLQTNSHFERNLSLLLSGERRRVRPPGGAMDVGGLHQRHRQLLQPQEVAASVPSSACLCLWNVTV